MSLWGKIIGGVTGFMTGGPLGAVVGAALGHASDQGVNPLGSLFGRSAVRQAADAAALLGSREQLFAITVVVLAAKLAKCDGPVKRAEIDAFKRLFRIPPENLREVAALFDQARDSADPAEPFAQRLGEAFPDNKGMLEDVLAALFQIALADGPLTKAELAFLQGVQRGFGLDARAWERARDGQTSRATGGGSGGGAMAETGPDPYAILGVSRDASDEALRQAWRRLMRENHPDSLASRGVPAEFVKRATEKVAEINAAWDRVKRERKL
ncbi:TerB family tellurite resistance protein [Belnapia sp. T6]|uniref:TerB family tellurite resistance protein n=1 Tax=Belnapia mucosa TaxID=2804532 RepID=A0ABS1V347_9PROT|nr:TerB family tellurite resistance protein [Belnapia mucosa]MBL6456123.1 TerB family tellurite resistance protein [Belnapia mucosa]